MNEKISKDPLWLECIRFHGHACPGLTIGYKAAIYAKELLSIQKESEDEEYVCISENNACGIDAIQVILSCTAGKGNLIINNVGKSAYNFYNRATGKSVRLILKNMSKEMGDKAPVSKEARYNYLHSKEPFELFDVQETTLEVPHRAVCFTNHTCSICGESVGEKWTRIVDGKTVCLTCYNKVHHIK